MQPGKVVKPLIRETSSAHLLHLVELFLGEVALGVAQSPQLLPRRVKVGARRRRRYHVARVLGVLHEGVVQPAVSGILLSAS